MKRNTGLLLVALLAALTLLASGCGEKQQTPDGAPDEPLMQEEDLTICLLYTSDAADEL